MVEWFKNICLSPFLFGLDKANIIAVKAITLIFNLYGKHLLKMDIDQIIKDNKCIENRNIFYLYPLSLKEIEQNIGFNIIKLEKGIINDLVISVPWKAILSETTHITIPTIELVLSLIQNKNIATHLSESMNTYFAANKSIYMTNQDLFMAYKEIKSILLQYFNKIEFDINFLKITLLNHFKITIHNIFFNDNLVQINKILIYDNDLILVEINKITFNINTNDLVIRELSIDSQIAEYIPCFYMYESTDNAKINISIEILKIDNILQEHQLLVKGLTVYIDSKTISIKKMVELRINELLLIHTSGNDADDDADDDTDDNILVYTVENKNCTLSQNFNIKVANISILARWFKNFTNIVINISNKYIVIGPDDLELSKTDSDKHLPVLINNISTTIVYDDDIFDLHIKTICISARVGMIDMIDIIDIKEVKVVYNNAIGMFDNIIIDEKNDIVLTNSVIKSLLETNQFYFSSKETHILKTINTLDIFFNNANVKNIIEVINFITIIVDIFVAKPILSQDIYTLSDSIFNNEKHNITLSSTIADFASMLHSIDKEIIDKEIVESNNFFMVKLHIKNSNIFAVYEERYFDIRIKTAYISVNTKEATDVVADIFMDTCLILKLKSEYISPDSLLIKSLCLFLDPEIFDQLNYLFGTLSPELVDESEPEYEISPDGLQQLREVLAKSIISHSMKDLEKKINRETQNIIQENYNNNNNNIRTNSNAKFLAKSIMDFRSILIENYRGEEKESSESNFKIDIETLRINLFDELIPRKKTNEKQKPSFLCCVIKNVFFRKFIEDIGKKDDDAMIHVFEKKIYSKPKTRTKYILKMKTGAIIDTMCHDPEWKYFVKFSDTDMMNVEVLQHGNILRTIINIQTLKMNIREETLLRFLAFLSTSYHIPKTSNTMYIEYFNISAINILVNYYPMIIDKFGTDTNILSLKNYKMRLSSQIITYIKSLDELIDIIGKQWKADVSPNNILQFIPNIRLFQPITTPIMQLIQLTTKYFNNKQNKKRIRSLTKNITHGADLVTNFVKYGITQVLDLLID